MKKFEKPEMEVIVFETEDIITDSNTYEGQASSFSDENSEHSMDGAGDPDVTGSVGSVESYGTTESAGTAEDSGATEDYGTAGDSGAAEDSGMTEDPVAGE